MAIKFKCPECGAAYQVRDELAGKKAPCKREGCGHVLTIPHPVANGSAVAKPESARVPAQAPAAPLAPESAPPVDDDLAASLLADDPTAAAEVAPVGKPIALSCHVCDHKFEAAADKAGKNVLCPECKSRIRVPEIKVEKPKDWREVDRRAAILKTDEPQDVWSTKQTTGPARTSLQEADALLDEELEPIPVARRIGQFLLGGAFLAAVAFGVLAFVQWRDESSKRSYMHEGLAKVQSLEGDDALPPTWLAAFHTYAGAHGLKFAQDQERLRGVMNHFSNARGSLSQASPGHDRDLVLGRLAAEQVGLAGTPEQIQAESRLGWDKVQEELRKTMQRLGGGRGDEWSKEEAFRELTARLAPAGEAERAAAAATVVFGPARAPEGIARIGIELFHADRTAAGVGDGQPSAREQAMALAARAEAAWVGGGKPSSPSLQALKMALGTDETAKPADKILPPPGQAEPSAAVREGYALGYTLQGKADEALKLADRPGQPEQRLRALLVVADALVRHSPQAAAPALTAADSVLSRDLRRQRYPEWLAYRLADLNARAGRFEEAAVAVEAIRDGSLKAWAQLAIFRAQLAASQETRTEELVNRVGTPDDLAHAVARFELARHNTRIAGPDAIEASVFAWPDRLQPFGLAGIAHGMD